MPREAPRGGCHGVRFLRIDGTGASDCSAVGVYAVKFHEDWYSDRKCGYLRELADRTNGLVGDVVEIGCWEGRSTIALADKVKPQRVLAVDTWEGSPGEISAELAAERDVYAQFKENTRGLNVVAYRKDWRDFTPPSHIRFLHIDALHTYDEVRATIEAFLPFMVDGGVIVGDDAHDEKVLQAARDVLEDVKYAGHTVGIDVYEPLWYWEKPMSGIARDYHTACRTPSDIYEHLPTFVELVTHMDAQTVIELGTRGAVSTIAWLYGLEETGGHLWSVDIDPAPLLEHDRWTFIQGDDLDPKTLAKLPDQADIVFIDTSHLYEQTLAELNVYRWRVRPGGRIVLHDTELRRPERAPVSPAYPVKRAVTEFCNEEGFVFTNDPRCFGLAQIQIPE